MSITGTRNVENLFHIILTISQRSNDINNEVEKVCVCGTYTNLGAAKHAAYQTLFEAGYEREWFTEYDTKPEDFIAHGTKRPPGLAVLAKSSDGTTFRISIATTPNVQGFRDDEDHKIHKSLYHVMQTNILYTEYDRPEGRETNIEASFLKYEQAREYARGILLDLPDGITKESFAEYDEAAPNETDCGYGENVVVHAAGQNGENYLISVLRGQDMESARLAEAAMRIRSVK